MAKSKDRREDESRRIINQVQAETDAGSLVGRTMRRLENHLGANDADQNDWAEVWGTRIGRSIGAFIVVATFIWLFRWMMGV